MLPGRSLGPTGITPVVHRHPEGPRGSSRQHGPDDPGDRPRATNAAGSRGKGRALGEVLALGARETHASVDGPAGTLEDRTEVATSQLAESDDEHRHDQGG